MIASLCYIESSKLILSCDGKEFTVIGDSPTAESIRQHAKDPKSLFSSVMKIEKDKFDPVLYWYESSHNFSDSQPPIEFSQDKLKEFTSKLKS